MKNFGSQLAGYSSKLLVQSTRSNAPQKFWCRRELFPAISDKISTARQNIGCNNIFSYPRRFKQLFPLPDSLQHSYIHHHIVKMIIPIRCFSCGKVGAQIPFAASKTMVTDYNRSLATFGSAIFSWSRTRARLMGMKSFELSMQALRLTSR